MPPNFTSIQPRSDNSLNNDSATPSIGTTNSSANLSVGTSSNLTATTMLNHQQGRGGGGGSGSSIMITSLKSSPSLKHNKAVSTATTTTTAARVSFKSRLSKVRLNRETDIMLIVLSFSILLSQLPFTIVWYLIYYRLVLGELRENNFDANSPKVFYIIRILEMIYFSLNFFFYITLSPSLRKEIKNYLTKRVLNEILRKYFLNKTLMKSHLSKRSLNNENELSGVCLDGGSPAPHACNGKLMTRKINALKHSDYDNHSINHDNRLG